MATDKLTIVDGPDKPALQWSLANSDPDVNFRTDEDALEAHITAMEEEGSDGFTFRLQGKVTTGPNAGALFNAVYSIESRSGWIEIGA